MSEIDSQQQQQTSDPPDESGLSETPPSPDATEPDKPAAPKVYTEMDNVPAWAVGKTPEEVIQLTGSLMDAMKTYDPNQQAPTPSPVAPVATSYQNTTNTVVPTNAPQIPNPSLAFDDPSAYATQMQAFLDHRDKALQDKLGQQLTSYMQPFSQTVGHLARQQVASSPAYKAVFDKWGHEIDQALAANGVAVGARTPKTYELMADIVKGRHVDELAKAEAERIIASGGRPGTVRGGVGQSFVPAQPPGDALDQAWEAGNIPILEGMKANKLTKEDVRRSIKLQGHTVDKWLTIASGDNIFVSPDASKTRTVLQQPGGNN